MNFDLEKHTIYRCISGSHAYGLARPDSDIDIRGIAIPPKKYYLGLSNFEQLVSTSPDITIFSLTKFCNLALQCNPNVIELLYVDELDIQKMTPIGRRLRESRDLFLSTKAKFTFSGYAFAQLKRIRNHYQWLRRKETIHKPTRAEYNLPDQPTLPADHRGAIESLIRKEIESWEVDWDLVDRDKRIAIQEQIENYLSNLTEGYRLGQIKHEELAFYCAANKVGIDTNLLELLEKERKYKSAMDEWHQYQDWLTNRNPARAELETKFGFDLKHASHLVRLTRMGKEILTTGKVLVKRPDAEELRVIRDGAWTYEQLLEYAEKEQAELDRIYSEGGSPLPRIPDFNRIEQLCVELTEEFLTTSGE